MARSTINVKNNLMRSLSILAKGENRSVPNFIETVLMRYLDNDIYADPFEMDAIYKDKKLKKSILSGLNDYKKRRGKFV